MAQTPSLSTDDSPRPLPRRERSSLAKTARPRLQALDGLWIALLAGLAAIVYALLPHKHLNMLLIPSLGAVIMNIGLVYLLGWRIRDRATGIVSALLLATSFPFLQGAVESPEGAILAALTVGSLLAFAADFSLAALILAGLATMLQPADALLGIVLLVFSFAQHRRRAVAGGIMFLLLALVGNGLLFFLGASNLHTLHWSNHLRLPGWTLAPASLFLLWFLLPFLGEWTDRARRSRWFPIVVWLILGSLAASFLHAGNTLETGLSFLPLFMLIVACGFSRLLPILAGEFTSLPMRYGVATVSALALVALRVPQEWRQIHSPSAPVPHVVPAAAAPTPVILPAPLPPPALPKTEAPQRVNPIAAPLVLKKPAKPQSKPIQAHKPAIKPITYLAHKRKLPTYVIRNGRRVRRSHGAIQWHRQHHYRR